ncbi:MAG: ATP-binding cassette domain-containing protein [Deltaproteobacteria bacterium]|nr:ATP-binding cassette domain-containing protein [Deltaproteobacteria bacterium]
MTANAPDHALEVLGVSKRYGTHVAVDDVSFVVPRGVVFALLGPNGAGKTTLMRLVNDIIALDAGQIRLFGDVPPGRRAAPRIGYLPEERGLYPKMKALDMLSFMAELRGLPPRDAGARARAWLERLGLAAWMGHKIQDLSKGMQQKVQFAAAVLHDPELVILDEPWSGLDPINAEVLKGIVAELRARGRTVIFSTHQMEQAEKMCDHVCIIARGRKVLDGVLADIKRAAADHGRVALAAVGDAAALQKVLDDRALVAARRAPPPGDVADHELALAPGVSPEALVRALLDAGLGIRKLEVVTPTLHQIFVERVGAEAAVAERRPGGAA